MKIAHNKTNSHHKILKSTQGFSLLETVIALTTLGICLAYAMPLFLYAKINNSKSDIRTGALIVAQRTFDNVRSRPIAGMPDNDGVASPTTGNPVTQPTDVNNPSDSEKLLTKAMGRQYQTKITYCEGKNVDATVCSSQYRKFKVEVSYRGSKVYDLEGTYTAF
ncbi:type II secretion system protein [Chamaesiphon sp. OTE_75_metabat_556]|uniref:type IV pilus modification PilV family protein n=1 Tax=Chamaesiphon sp. OTE_75_metabat_556 TaxID=2964692 RepID=UPI00286BDD01|nr:type II secretion system protein [Chamaesiphon sp. OTE_75_metabat_556]